MNLYDKSFPAAKNKNDHVDHSEDSAYFELILADEVKRKSAAYGFI